MGTKIMVDSASDICMEEAKSMGVILLPIEIRFDEEVYMDGENLLPKEFYEKLIKCDKLPQTSQINPFRFEDEFKKATENGDDVILITLSSQLSGTYQSALSAAEKFQGKVFVVDSLTACTCERLLCMYAVQLVKQGLSTKAIVDELNEAKNKVHIIATIDTLKYLKKGGRISAATAIAGALLSIKPVVAIVDGKVGLVGKAMGSRKAKMLVTSLAKERGEIDFSMPYGVVWSGLNETIADNFLNETKDFWMGTPVDTIPKYIIGSTIGTHVGPGALGVAFFTK